MTTINDLCVTSSVSSDDKLPVWQNANGVTRALPISVLDSRYLTQDDVALLAISPNVEIFKAGVDFTPGVSLALTLANQYMSASNVEVFFDASFQGPDQYSIAGYGMVFTSPIPDGVSSVYVRGGVSRLVGAPSDGTVTTPKLVDSAVTTPKLADKSVTTAKFADGAIATKMQTEAINQPGTGQFFAQNGAQIQRMNDRVFMGGATVSDGAFPPVTQDWFSLHEQDYGYQNYVLNGALTVLTSAAPSAQGTNAALFAAQSLTATSQFASCIGAQFYAVNNHASLPTSAWGVYIEAHHDTAAAGTTYCIEFDLVTKQQGSSPTPYAQGAAIGLQCGAGAGVLGETCTGFISGNQLVISGVVPQMNYVPQNGDSVTGVGVAAGTVITGTITSGTYTVNISQTVSTRYLVIARQYDASAAIQIVNNPTRWGVGINFMQTSLVGCDGTNGVGVAVAMAKGHSLQWYTPSGFASASVLSTIADPTKATGINFSDIGLQVFGPSGVPLAYFSPTANAANYLTFIAGTTGQAATVAANGSDTNVNLKLSPQGSGLVQFGTYTAGAVAQAGYISIVDAGGTVRRLLVG
jgi:hypothetical protein